MAKAENECVYVVVVACSELLPFCRVALCIMQLNRKMFFSLACLFASPFPLPMYLPFDKRLEAFELKLNLVCLAVAFYGFVSTAFESKSSTFTRFTNLKSKIGSDSASLFLLSSSSHPDHSFSFILSLYQIQCMDLHIEFQCSLFFIIFGAMFGIHINLSRWKLMQMSVYFGIFTLNHQWNYELHTVRVWVQMCAHVFLRHDEKKSKSNFVSQFVHFSIGRWIGLWSSHRLCLINWMKRS